jgi:hypothetical protein
MGGKFGLRERPRRILDRHLILGKGEIHRTSSTFAHGCDRQRRGLMTCP